MFASQLSATKFKDYMEIGHHIFVFSEAAAVRLTGLMHIHVHAFNLYNALLLKSQQSEFINTFKSLLKPIQLFRTENTI